MDREVVTFTENHVEAVLQVQMGLLSFFQSPLPNDGSYFIWHVQCKMDCKYPCCMTISHSKRLSTWRSGAHALFRGISFGDLSPTELTKIGLSYLPRTYYNRYIIIGNILCCIQHIQPLVFPSHNCILIMMSEQRIRKLFNSLVSQPSCCLRAWVENSITSFHL